MFLTVAVSVCRAVIFMTDIYTDSADLTAFSAEFARVVTASTNDNADWVARNGKESIYGILREMLPQVWTTHTNQA